MQLHHGTLASLAVALAAASAVAQAQPDVKERTITVTGAGSVKFRPEGAKISFGIRAADNAFTTAWKDNQVQADKLRTALEGLKLTGMQVKIAPPDVSNNDNLANGVVAPMPGGVPGGFNDKAFNVSRSFQVVVADSDFNELHKQVLKVMETALSHGANCPANVRGNNEFLGGIGAGFPQGPSITRVEFFSNDDKNARQKAYEKAVQAAVANAKGAAKGAEVTLGNVVSIVDHQEVNYNLNIGIPTMDAPQQEVNGEIELTIRVKVTMKF